MYFQINVTPKGRMPEIEERQEPPTLLLAPFQPQTRLQLETNLNSKTCVNLKIKNPSNRILNVKVTKRPPIERVITLSYSDVTIEPNNDSTISLSWTPREVGSWRDTLQLTDSRRIKYDVALILNCNGVKKGTTKGVARIQVLTQSSEVLNINMNSKNVRDTSTVPIKQTNTAVYSIHSEDKENIAGNSKNIMESSRKTLSKTRNIVDTNTCTVNNLDVSHFQLTPINAYHYMKSMKIPNIRILDETPSSLTSYDVEHIDSAPEIRVLDATKEDFTPSHVSLISPKNIDVGPSSRRDTYINPAPKFFKQMHAIDNTADETFDDSLSSLAALGSTGNVSHHNFSMALSDIVDCTTPIKLISPTACSTGHKSDSNSRIYSDSDSLPLAGNSTFDIIAVDSGDIGNAIKSPKLSHATGFIRPSRLTATFAKVSPNSLPSDIPKINLISSSPTPMLDHRHVIMASSAFRSGDSTSAKAIVEADLWANNEHFPPPSTSSINYGKFNDILEMISEETVTVTKKINVETGRRCGDTYISTMKIPPGLCVEISPPKKIANNTRNAVKAKKISPIKHNRVTKDKVVMQHSQLLRKKIQKPNTLSNQRSDAPVSGVRINKLCLTNLNGASLTNKSTVISTATTTTTATTSKNNSKHRSGIKISNSNDIIESFRNRDPFSATMTEDPFLTRSLYYDDKWIYHQELEFTKWLNALLTPPEHSADVDTACIDVGKVWQSCRAKENVALAETKEAVSARYHNTDTRLNTLRKAGCAMFARDEVKMVLVQVVGCIDREILTIRQDRDLHRDIGLQKAILELLLSYNPLWLRIGLEVVYGETIPLNSNNDLIGLTRFLIARFFSDPYLVEKYSYPNVLSFKLPIFPLHMNKFLLKKFLLIVYFLDYAKKNKLIGHDPCLFHKKAPHKDSRAILLSFSREVLSGVGDLTKILRAYGYIVSHKQTYLDEYNYAVKDISSDLRDGVRLCRVMELIIGDRTLTCQCRVPAISRLQKIYNVDVALKALIAAGYQIIGDIDAKSVVDGHKEKTLSLLWQIIYKFQRPRFENAAILLQKWWRAMLWYVRVKNYLSLRRNNAVCVIQRAWRCHRAKKLTQVLHEARVHCLAVMEKSVRIIQSRWILRRRMLHDRRNFLQMKAATTRIQMWFRQIRACRPYLHDLQKKRRAVITLQCYWRAMITMRRERIAFQNIKDATVLIQRWWRATSLTLSTQHYYLKLRATVTCVQSKWRAQRQMKIERNHYIKTHDAIIKIQIWWQAIIIGKRIRNNYILQKNATRVIESWWIYGKLMRVGRKKFSIVKNSAITIQRCWRKYRETKNLILSLNFHNKAAITIQTWWRSVKHRREYCVMRNSAIVIERWWRALIITRRTASTYALVRKSAIDIEKTWKMIQARRKYLKIKGATQIIQMWYRDIKKMRAIRRDFIIKKKAILHIQCWWRNLKLTTECKQQYLVYKSAVVLIQTRWREIILAKSTRRAYLTLKIATQKIQAYWRIIRIRRVYLRELKRHKAALVLQRRWRANKIGRETRENYIKQQSAVHFIQRKYRAIKFARTTKIQFFIIKRAAIIIQKNWRMFKATRDFNKIKYSTIIIQAQWRARKLAIVTRKSFITLKNSVITIQRCYRSWRISKKIRNNYLITYRATLTIQRAYKATILMQQTRKQYLEYRNAVVCVQSIWRMVIVRKKYLSKLHAALIIQRKWRSIVAGRIARNQFLTLKMSSIFIQRRYRLNKVSIKIRQDYILLRNTVIWAQKIWRDKQLARVQSAEFVEMQKRHNAAIIIQAYWRGHKIRTLQSAMVQQLRERSKKAAALATPLTTVEYRLQTAMDLLQNSTNIGQLSLCLTCIDTLTRLSPKGCVLFCQLHLIDRIYVILERANRSLPWMDVCKRCSNILITLVKLPQTAAAVRNIEATETIVRLMNAAIKHDIDLFLHLATLFWLLLNNGEFASKVESSPRTIWLLRSLIITATKKESASLMKSKSNDNLIGQQPMLLPNLKPDWGMKTRRPRCFITIHHAISTLMDQLNITLTV